MIGDGLGQDGTSVDGGEGREAGVAEGESVKARLGGGCVRRERGARTLEHIVRTRSVQSAEKNGVQRSKHEEDYRAVTTAPVSKLRTLNTRTLCWIH